MGNNGAWQKMVGVGGMLILDEFTMSPPAKKAKMI